MKNFLFSLILTLLIAFTANGQTVSPSAVNVTATATVGQTINITGSPNAWVVTVPNWIELSVYSGSTPGSFIITAIEDNTDINAGRTGTITINFAGGVVRTVTVNQSAAPATMILSQTSNTVSATMDLFSLTLDSDVNWTGLASSSSNWLRFYTGSGGSVNKVGVAGSSTFQYEVDNNITGTSRTGILTFTSASGVTIVTLTVTQNAQSNSSTTLSVNKNAVEFEYNETVIELVKKVEVTSNDNWNITVTNGSWLDISSLNNNTTFNGDQILELVPGSVNNGTTARTATVTLTSGSLTAEYTITQKAEDITTGIFSSTADQDFLIYPNPSTGSFNVKSENIKSISIFNDMGGVISSESIETEQHFDLPTGIYFVEVIKQNGRRSIKKLIVM